MSKIDIIKDPEHSPKVGTAEFCNMIWGLINLNFFFRLKGASSSSFYRECSVPTVIFTVTEFVEMCG